MIHKLNLESYTIGDEIRILSGERVVSDIKKDSNEKVTSLEVAQLFVGDSIHVGIYKPTNESENEQIYHLTRIIKSDDLDYQKYIKLFQRD
jgi:hypothetical protein